MHQVARWLETIYEPQSRLDHINAPPLNVGPRDFDQEKSKASAKADHEILSAVFDHLRGGKLQEVQSFLNATRCDDKYLYLLGNLPFFDNCSYAQQTESGDVFLNDLDLGRHNDLDRLTKKLGFGSDDLTDENVCIGNRCNMLFVEGCLTKLKMDFESGLQNGN